jgi:hypothetical protein
MHFDMQGAPIFLPEGPQVGYVYLSKNSRTTKYWVIVAINGRMAVMLGLDAEGNVVSGSNYGLHCFEDHEWGPGRKPIGVVRNMPDMCFDVEWSAS